MKVKVAQCWDDGVATDIRLTEILRKYNAKATFNLCPGTISEETIKPYWVSPTETEGWSHRGFRGGKVGKRDLKAVYGGFQVASHCWMHENAGSMPDADFLKAALDARNFLEDIFQQECRGFAWPCGKHTPETERLLAEAGFRYGRTVENAVDVTACTNPLALPSNCHFLDGAFWRKFLEAKKTGKNNGFEKLPDLLLIDGGQEHAAVALSVLLSLGLEVPVFGMVKDDRHRTRALVTPEGREIGIQANQAVFALIGNIQEETHRYSIDYQRSLRQEAYGSSLDRIPGVGAKRRDELIRAFKSVRAIREASVEQLRLAVPKNTAQAVYDYFHKEGETACESSPAPPADGG